jgi:cation diffusion facilitator family transporter
MSTQSKKKQSVALSSVFASAGLTLIKLVVGVLTGSIGIISEAAHSALDLGAALLTFFAVKIGDKPADEKHHYGHAKVESVSALIETGLLFLTSVWIIYEAGKRLLSGEVEVEATWYAFAVMIVSILIDFSRSRALTRVAKETNSQALEADALHFSSDIYSSLVVLVGLVLVLFDIKSADAYAAIAVSIFVFYAGLKLGKRTIDVLVDTAPEGIREKVMETTDKTEGVIGLEKIRIRQMAGTSFIDLTVYVSRKLALLNAQAIADALVKNIRASLPHTDITIHTKPLPLDNETLLERVQIAAAKHNLMVHDIVVHTLKDRKFINFDLEVNEGLKLKKAHELASHLEKEIRAEVGNNVEINTHIEPLRTEAISGQDLPLEEENGINAKIRDIAGEIPEITEIHGIRARQARNKLFISCHCIIDGDTLLEEAHNIATRLEYMVKDQIPLVQRVVVHTEPA